MEAPAFVERTPATLVPQDQAQRVAGVEAPAFVERGTSNAVTASCTSVAGVEAPAFVERTR